MAAGISDDGCLRPQQALTAQDVHPTSPVTMPVMQVRIVRMRVLERFVAMPVRMRLCHRPVVLVLVVRVVNMEVFVLELLVRVLMFVPLT